MKNTKDTEPFETVRPYERCLKYGPASLSDSELLAVIIRTGVPGMSATGLAEEILARSVQKQKLLGICHSDIEELTQIPGIGKVKAIQIKCIGELSKRIAMYQAKEELSFNNPKTISDYYMEQLRHKDRELLICMLLDIKNHLLKEKVITKGTVNASIISPRDLFIEALKVKASNMILVHNHPGGDPSPSKEDIRVTLKVREAGELIDISLIDHIIIGDRKYFSFRQEDML